MKKLLSLLSGGIIKDVGNVIDKLTTTDEERLAAKQKIQELLEKADQDVILIPLHSDLTTSNVDRIIDAVKTYDKL